MEAKRFVEEEEKKEKRKGDEEDARKAEEQQKKDKWEKFDKLKLKVKPLIDELSDVYRYADQELDLTNINDRKRVNKDMIYRLKRVNDFKNRNSEKDWRAIAYKDYDDCTSLIKAAQKFISEENINIPKFEKELLEQQEKRAKSMEEDLAIKAAKEQARLDAEKQRKAEKMQKEEEDKRRFKEAQEQLQKQLEREKAVATTKYEKIVNDLKDIVARLQVEKVKFEQQNPNNIVAREASLRRYTAILDEYFAYKQTVERKDWKYVYPIWGDGGITEKELGKVEIEMASYMNKFTKEIETKKLEKEKEKQEKEERVAIRQAQIDKIVNKIKELDEEIGALYLENEREEIRDAMTISQRDKLYAKILKIYNSYLFEKKKLSTYEYTYLLERNPEWEIFDRIKQNYISAEKELIKQLKEIEAYTDEQLDVMTAKQLQKLVDTFGPYNSIKWTRKQKDINNALQRAQRREAKAAKGK